MPDKPGSPQPSRRDKTINIRIDPELYEQATSKAEWAGVAAVVRAFLRGYVRGAVEPPQEDLAKELQWTPRRSRKPRKPASAKGGK
jgi:hypothetical protein